MSSIAGFVMLFFMEDFIIIIMEINLENYQVVMKQNHNIKQLIQSKNKPDSHQKQTFQQPLHRHRQGLKNTHKNQNNKQKVEKMYQQNDSYTTPRALQIQSAFLNFSPSFSSSNPEMYTFSGNSYSLSSKAKQISDQQLSKYKSIRINITGNVIKNANVCCFWNTVIWGSIFLFPLFFICCDWWKKTVNRLFSVDVAGYDGVADILRMSGAHELYLMVQDNMLDANKANIIYKALERSNVRNFVFNNIAVGFNTENNNYSNFDTYMRPIKELRMNSDISWGNKFVI